MSVRHSGEQSGGLRFFAVQKKVGHKTHDGQSQENHPGNLSGQYKHANACDQSDKTDGVGEDQSAAKAETDDDQRGAGGSRGVEYADQSSADKGCRTNYTKTTITSPHALFRKVHAS